LRAYDYVFLVYIDRPGYSKVWFSYKTRWCKTSGSTYENEDPFSWQICLYLTYKRCDFFL